jgi:lipid II:glycine glycyltransferase (peptidoglycan interpeptide bridge formation enzyme)
MPVVSLAEWNQYLQKYPNAHLLQTGEWGELKSAFGWTPVRLVNGDAGVQILFRKLPLGFTIGYIPKAVISKQWTVDSGQFSVFSEIDSVCKHNRAIFLKIEPDLWDDQKPDTWNLKLETSVQNIQPPRTIIVDISGTEEEILARMKQKTRYNIRLAEKKGVILRVGTKEDFGLLYKMYAETSVRDGFVIRDEGYYQTVWKIFMDSHEPACEPLIAEVNGEPVAAIFVFFFAGRAYYVYGMSRNAHREKMPTHLF